MQKYRLYLRRLSGVSQHQGVLNNSFISPQDAATFGAISSLNGTDFQSLAAAGQIPPQSLATLQASGLGRSTAKTGMPMPLVDQRNIFSFESPRLRFGEGQQQQYGSSSKPMNLLHGIPTNMEPKQLASLHQSTQPLGNLNMRVNASPSQSNPLLLHISQSQPRGHMLGEHNVSHVSRLPTSMGQSSVVNGSTSNVLGRNGIPDNSRGVAYSSVPQNSSMLNFPMSQTTEMPASSFPLGSTPDMSSITSKGVYQDGVASGMKGTPGFSPSYDIFNELHHHKSREWEAQNMGPSRAYEASQHVNSLQRNIDVSPSVLVHQGFSSNQQIGQNRDVSSVGRTMFPLGESIESSNFQNISQHHGFQNSHLTDSAVRVKAERIHDANSQTNLFPEHYGQEDLMSALLKQVG